MYVGMYVCRVGYFVILFFHHTSSSLVHIRLYTENELYYLPGSALTVPVGGGWLRRLCGFEGKLSDRLWLELCLSQAEQ